MKPITVRNEDGETIEVRKTVAGAIEIRHSDISKEEWGEFQDIGLTIRGKEAIGKVKIAGKSCILDSKELTLIREAVRQLG